MSMPWDYSQEGTPETGVPNQPTEEGRLLGVELARIVAFERERNPALPEPCHDCAARAGTVPNGCPTTLLDLIKCGVENSPFMCHVNEGKPCAGWLAMKTASPEEPTR